MTREEAINKLEYLINSPVGREEIDATCYEVMDYLSAQEPRVMTLEKVRNLTRFPVWLDVKSTHKDLYRGWVLAYMVQKGMGITGERLGMTDPSGRMHWYKLDDYGRTWRVWDSIPTDTEKEAIPW